MWLLESWEKVDLDRWADGRRAEPLPDGVILGHQGYRDDDVRRLMAENPALRFHDYFTVWTYPDGSWVGQGNAFFDYMQALLSQYGLLWFDGQTGYPGIATFKDRVLVRLDDRIAASAPSEIARVILATARGGGIFLDQYYPDGLDQWMAKDFGGNFLVERLNPDHTAHHTKTLKALAVAISAGGPLLTGGTSTHAEPGYGVASRYFEGVGTFGSHPWDDTLPLWKEESSNVLSVLAEDEPQVTRALDEWKAWGSWLAFTTQLEGEAAEHAVRAAYERARQHRAGTTTPPSPGGPSTAPDMTP
jgi:hypothetical protein